MESLNQLANFHFLRPQWLWILGPLILLMVMGLRRSNSGDWQSQVDRELLPHLLEGAVDTPRKTILGLATLGGLLATIALAGPAWRELPQPLFRNQSGIVLALDLSRSMNATDLKPDRLSRARFKINDIIKAWPDGQIALLVYAADAFTVTPLTDDRATLALQLPALTSDLMPAQGSNPLAAIGLANKLLHQAGLVNGEIWLLTDGLPEPSDVDELVEAAGDYPVSVLGIGTPQGAPISTPGGFLKDRQGNIVVPKLNEAALRKLATNSGGRYARISGNNRDIDHLLASGQLAGTGGAEQQQDRLADLWQEEGPWLLLPLLLIAVLAFRRGYLVILLAVVLVPPPAYPLADDDTAHPLASTPVSWQQRWDSLWQTPNQRAQQAFNRGDNQTAIESFDDPAWQAAARYRQGDYAGAAAALADQTGANAAYNRGNANAQSGDYQGALEDYQQVLDAQPDNEDARFNQALVQKLLEQQQQKNQSDQSQNPDDQQDDNQEGDQNDDQNGAGNEDAGDENKSDSGEPSAGEKQNDDNGENQSSDSDKADHEPNSENQQQADDDRDVAPEKGENPGQPEDREQQPEDHQGDPAAATEMTPMDEETRQATEQWLRRIPDDPGGLLRRKFKYQYQRRNGNRNNQQGEGW